MIVVLESPYAGDIEKNKEYLQRCLRDSLYRGESPVASHALYTQALDDNDPDDRSRGIAAGFAFYAVASMCVVYTDLGISPGMRVGIAFAERAGVRIEYRSLAPKN